LNDSKKVGKKDDHMKIPEDGNHKKKATYPLPSKQGRRNQAATHQLGRERKLKGSEDSELNEKKVKMGRH
jgi:hypothetical protein